MLVVELFLPSSKGNKRQITLSMSILKHERYRLLKFIVLNMRMAFCDKTEGVRLNVSQVERKNASL